jgi:hypothetical protein
MNLPEWLLSTLACPRCKGPLTPTLAELCCPTCGRAYPIRDGIPVLLPEESRPYSSSGR